MKLKSQNKHEARLLFGRREGQGIVRCVDGERKKKICGEGVRAKRTDGGKEDGGG